MKSYFFIPASKINKIIDMQHMGITDIIIDLEDAIKTSEISIFVDEIIEANFSNYHVRVPIYNSKDELNLAVLTRLIEKGFTRFVLPKLANKKDVGTVYRAVEKKNVKCILLIEHPLLMLEIKEVLEEYGSIIYGLALGSHDFMAHIGGIHDLNNLCFYRQLILLHARAFGKLAIDIASMEISNKKALEKEILNGFNLGFDGKFLIHPKQFKVMKSIKFYSTEDLKWAREIHERLEVLSNENEFDPIVINGKIVEKPHIKKSIDILNFFNNEG